MYLQAFLYFNHVASEIILQNGFEICLSRNMLFVPDDETTPTPTPTITPEEPLNCCMDFDNTIVVTPGMADSSDPLTFRGITFSGFEIGGTLCINELSDTVESLTCLASTADMSIFGTITLAQRSPDNKLRYTSTEGDCYEADLEDSPSAGFVLLKPIT